jgi:hypothetical protein
MTRNILYFIHEMQFNRHKREIGNIMFLSELRVRDPKKRKKPYLILSYSEMVLGSFKNYQDLIGRIGALFRSLKMHRKKPIHWSQWVWTPDAVQKGNDRHHDRDA